MVLGIFRFEGILGLLAVTLFSAGVKEGFFGGEGWVFGSGESMVSEISMLRGFWSWDVCSLFSSREFLTMFCCELMTFLFFY